MGQQQDHDDGPEGGKIQALPGGGHDFPNLPGTVVAGNNGLQCPQHAHEKQEQGHPQAAANTHCRKILGTRVAGHNGIDHAVGHLGQLGDQDRPAQNGEGSPLCQCSGDQRLAGFR